MKRIISIAIISLALTLQLVAATPAPAPSAAPTELIIAAAASLTDAMNELAALYHKTHTSITITPTYGSSGALQKQIEQGAPVDLFISAAPKQMDALDKQKLIDTASRKDLLLNQVVLVAPAGSQITSFKDLALSSVKMVALGEPASVPAGQYAEQVFTFLGILDAVKAKAVYAKDVRQVLAYVESGEVDAGVVYATDAVSSKTAKVITAAPAGSHSPVLYPAAAISASTHPGETKAFLAWLSTPEAQAVFKKYGFAFP